VKAPFEHAALAIKWRRLLEDERNGAPRLHPFQIFDRDLIDAALDSDLEPMIIEGEIE